MSHLVGALNPFNITGSAVFAIAVLELDVVVIVRIRHKQFCDSLADHYNLQVILTPCIVVCELYGKLTVVVDLRCDATASSASVGHYASE